MKPISRFIVLLAVLLAAVAVIPAMAQAITVTLTESQINSGWRVTTSVRLRVSDVSVDSQPGQAVINATLTPRRGGSYTAQLIASPTVSNGAVTWTALSATVDGQAASGDQITQINTALLDSWRNYIKTNIGQRTVTAVTITADAITYTISGGTAGGTVTVDTSSVTATLTESTINSSWRIVTSTRLRVSNVSVDLQPNQAVITGTLTLNSGTVYNVQLVTTPTVSGGKVTWTVLSATVNGQVATSTQLTQINTAILNSWTNYISTQYGPKTVTAVTITDTDITYITSK